MFYKMNELDRVPKSNPQKRVSSQQGIVIVHKASVRLTFYLISKLSVLVCVAFRALMNIVVVPSEPRYFLFK